MQARSGTFRKAIMFRPAMLALSTGLILTANIASGNAASFLELGQQTPKDTILSIGTTPEPKTISLNLGSLRTGEAQLPPPPLTRAERMALRARMGVTRQQDVSNARRPTAVRVNRDASFDEDEFQVDEDGEPVPE